MMVLIETRPRAVPKAAYLVSGVRARLVPVSGTLVAVLLTSLCSAFASIDLSPLSHRSRWNSSI